MHDSLLNQPVHHFDISTETLITITGFLGAILLLLDVITLR